MKIDREKIIESVVGSVPGMILLVFWTLLSFGFGIVVQRGAIVPAPVKVEIAYPSKESVSIRSVPMLDNPDFELGTHLQDGIGELQVPDGWMAWYIEGGSPRRHRPEYKPEIVGSGSGRVYSGQKSAKMFTTYAPHEGGLKTCKEGFVEGARYVVSGWVYVWSSSGDNPDESVGDGKYMTAIGVNAWGEDPRTYHNKNQMQWSKGTFRTDEWVYHELEFVAWSGKMCLYTLGQPEYGAKHNDSYWDNFNLKLADSQPAQPTYTPYPTHTPAPTYTPLATATPNPTYTPPPTYTPVPGCTPQPTVFKCEFLVDELTGTTVLRCADEYSKLYQDTSTGEWACPK